MSYVDRVCSIACVTASVMAKASAVKIVVPLGSGVDTCRIGVKRSAPRYAASP